MKEIGRRLIKAAFIAAAGALLAAAFDPVFAQAIVPEANRSVPQDWSHEHLVYTNADTLNEAAGKGTLAFAQWTQKAKDPRFIAQVVRKTRLVQPTGQSPFSGQQLQWANRFRRDPPTAAGSDIHRDWSNVLGGATGVGKAGVSPAKFNFDINATPSCASDFVVYTTASSGTTGSGALATRNGTFTAGTPTAGQTATITNGTRVLTLTASTSLNTGTNFLVSANTTTNATNLRDAINRNGGKVGVTATSTGAVVTVTAITHGTGANSIALADTMSVFSWAGTTLTGGSGTAGQPTIVAFNQLYSSCGTTSTPVPATFWSYNTGTAAFTETSPVLSLDGTQVAFVQRTGTAASLVLLKWSSTVSVGTVGAPTAPTSVTLANYRMCTAPCMTVNALNGNPNNTTSSPFYDYLADTLYVGDSTGKLHKFTGVFSGTPAEVVSTGANVWPAVVSTTALTSPVYDSVTSKVFVGSTRSGTAAGTGALHAVNNTIGSGTGGITASAQLFVNSMTGIFDTPIVDSTTGKVYVFVGDDFNNAGRGAIYQYAAGTSLATGSQTPNKAVLGSGAVATTLYSGTFDDTYYSGTGNTGSLYVCGLNPAGNALSLYAIPMSVTFGTTVSLGANVTSAAAQCSQVTEFMNGTNDYLFFSVSANGNDTGCTGACVYMYQLPIPAGFDTTSTSSSATGTQYMSVSTPAALSGTEAPVRTTISTAATFTGMTITQSVNNTNPRTMTYTLRKNGANGTITCVVAANASSCSDTTHSDSFVAGDTIDLMAVRSGGSQTMTIRVQLTAGAAGAGLSAPGGTSGIIIDNVATGGGSQIYYSTLTSPGNAIQASQAALQ